MDQQKKDLAAEAQPEMNVVETSTEPVVSRDSLLNISDVVTKRIATNCEEDEANDFPGYFGSAHFQTPEGEIDFLGKKNGPLTAVIAVPGNASAFDLIQMAELLMGYVHVCIYKVGKKLDEGSVRFSDVRSAGGRSLRGDIEEFLDESSDREEMERLLLHKRANHRKLRPQRA